MLRSHVLHDALHNLGLSLLARLIFLLFVFLEQAVEAVFHLDLGAALDLQTNLVPLAPELLPQFQYIVLFFYGPFVAPHTRIDHVDPPLSALSRLPLTPRPYRPVKLFCNTRPFFRLH